MSVSKPGIKPRMEGLYKRGQGPISGCCAIEEEEDMSCNVHSVNGNV
jgi:hypothetical protein